MEVECPFCKDKGMDLVGLKHHILTGYCEGYEKTMTIWEESEARKNGTLATPPTENEIAVGQLLAEQAKSTETH
jgi:hypothetical protein